MIQFYAYFVQPYSSAKLHLLNFLGLLLNHTGEAFNKQSYASLPLSNYCVISLEDEVTMFQDGNRSKYCPTVD